MKSIFLMLFILCANANATDAYNSATNQLSLGTVSVGTTKYSDVVITVGQVVTVGGKNSTPLSNANSYDPTKNNLTISSVTVGTNVYTDVVVTVGQVVAVGNSVTGCISKPALPSGKYRSTVLDMRFDQGNDTNLQGYLVNSLKAVSPIIDKIDCVGFDTLIFQTNIPLDPATGDLVMYDPDPTHYNRDKHLPADFWPLVKYAKSKGLRVFVKAIPVQYANDTNFCPVCFNTPVTPAFADKFFNSLMQYETMLATQAQAYNVDGFYIGVLNIGLDNDQYSTNWTKLITQIRSVFTGKLIYLSCYQCANTVWSKVDLVGLMAGDLITTANATSLPQLLNTPTVNDLVAFVKTNFAQYQKPIMLDEISINATGNSTDVWSLLQNNLTAAGAQFNNAKSNYPLQSIEISAMFELAAGPLSNNVSALAFREYMPWAESSWIQNPQNNPYGISYSVWEKLGISLYHNTSAQAKLSQYLQQPWGYRTL